ncbi:hypothetical protein MLD38_030994 [Melastoma candidum]|uniref:Uncharacterized protein n=1 Tax=Melastoma candidum TaxID=119954 RepID=A0ACB9MN73_9MYRT|nr:hypothetical protein MLD38_030994 [Melastoma candidum]
MSSLKITKKHHRRLNNPFPSPPKSLPFIQGSLFIQSPSLTSTKVFPIGNDFQLGWSPQDGGSLSVSHRGHPAKAIWSTVPGRAFVSAALAESEIEESRGSFLIKDRRIHLICDHQTVEDIRVIGRTEDFPEDFDPDYQREFSECEQDSLQSKKFPVLLITGRIFSSGRKDRKDQCFGNNVLLEKDSAYGQYHIIFDQKTSSQVEFQVKLGKPRVEFGIRLSPASVARRRLLKLRLNRSRKKRHGWHRIDPRTNRPVMVAPAEEEEVAEITLPENLEFNRVCFTYSSEQHERFYGFGEQFSHMNFKGKKVPIFVQEQGIGRGDQPISFAANLVSHRAGGDWSTTYAPSPFYMTSKMRSLYLEGYNYSVFDLTKHDRAQIQVHANSIQGRILCGDSPTEILESFTETIGRPPELPEWIISGAIVGMQGGTDMVRHVWDVLKAYDVPISAFWLQDWVGQRETFIGSQLWWNWEVDTVRYWGWQKLIEDLKAQDIRVMTYCNPCLALTEDKPNRRTNMFEEAKRLGILVKDKYDEPYMVPNTAFDVGMLDLTHPDTAMWFKKILQEMVDSGVRGWMADFGEGLPVDAHLYSGEDPIVAHNRYPELWAKINREFVDEWKSSRPEKEDPKDELVFFMRAGFRDSPKWGMVFWEGDQMVSWQRNDGIKSAVVGLLSSGLSGYAFNHSDIGGYCGVSFPIIMYKRSEELLLRWMELNAFTTVFRTHEGNKPSCNTQFYSNDRTYSHFARFSKVFNAWKFYRIQLVKEASQKGLPICRHLFLHYPDDDRVHRLTYQQFLVGSEILVIPVLDKARNKIKAYLPIGEDRPWLHIWSGRLYSDQGTEIWVEAPLGYPAVFVKAGSGVGNTFLKNLRDSSLL